MDSTHPFTWSTAQAAQDYWVTIGTASGGWDVFSSGPLAAGTSSVAVPALPAGPTLYARIYSLIGGSWNNYEDVSFTAQNAVSFTYPSAGQTNVDTTRPFTWTTTPAAQSYTRCFAALGVGDSRGIGTPCASRCAGFPAAQAEATAAAAEGGAVRTAGACLGALALSCADGRAAGSAQEGSRARRSLS